MCNFLTLPEMSIMFVEVQILTMFMSLFYYQCIYEISYLLILYWFVIINFNVFCCNNNKW